MPSASTHPAGSTCRTWSKPRTSRRRRAPLARSRNRFDVSLARLTCPAPSLSCAARASFFLLCSRLLAVAFVQESPRHRIRGHAHVALREHDLEPVSYTHLTLPTSDLV